MKHRVLLFSLAWLGTAATASAGVLSDAFYRLYWLSPGGPVRVYSAEVLPAGSNVAPDNQWRYDYEVVNKSVNPLNAFYSFFNSDNVNNAQFVSGTAPTDWTILQQGPVAPNFNFKVRHRTLIAGAKIPQNGTLVCSDTFAWTGSVTPGAQNYDFVTDGGSESGVTVERNDTTPAMATTWGRLKSLYRE
jgi:hypothetical protein